jgi:uncharacterized protein
VSVRCSRSHASHSLSSKPLGKGFAGGEGMSSSHNTSRPLAVVTGASSGIGYELANLCAQNGFDLIVAADEPLAAAAATFRGHGATIETIETDLARLDGVDQLVALIGDRPVEALLANAGHGLGQAFFDQEFEEIEHVIDTNITGTIYLIHQVGRRMRERGRGRILITGSIAGYMPGSFHAVYNASKAFVDSFSYALRNELKDTGVTVTCLMPGATETRFFERAGLMDTKVGTDEKDDAEGVAQDGFDAMMKGEAEVVSGWKNKVQTTVANVTPNEMLAEQHRKMTEPGTAKKK